jgi:hypothetical protein
MLSGSPFNMRRANSIPLRTSHAPVWNSPHNFRRAVSLFPPSRTGVNLDLLAEMNASGEVLLNRLPVRRKRPGPQMVSNEPLVSGDLNRILFPKRAYAPPMCALRQEPGGVRPWTTLRSGTQTLLTTIGTRCAPFAAQLANPRTCADPVGERDATRSGSSCYGVRCAAVTAPSDSTAGDGGGLMRTLARQPRGVRTGPACQRGFLFRQNMPTT